MHDSATYSPDDNKLRLYPAARLDAETYARVKAAGFTWAPKQGLFCAAWTPGREDLLLELCEEIGDEDKSLTERAEERADRFDGYKENRTRDAERARKAVSAIADHIPLGQPILIGHHSERHARRDAEKIQNGMARAVKMWDTAQYWQSRAAGALAHAKYKELPAVRARRIKTIEADQRKQQKYRDKAAKLLAVYEDPAAPGVKLKDGRFLIPALLGSYEGGLSYEDQRKFEKDEMTLEAAQAQAIRNQRATITYCDRWLTHYAHRLEYERAMLAESGGLVSDRHKFEIGGQVLRRHGQWFIITKVNAGSVSVRGHFASTIPFDEIKDYKAPNPGDTEKVKAATKLAPLCNYPGEGFKHMTKAELKADRWRMYTDSPKTRWIKATETHGLHRVQQTRGESSAWSTVGVFVTDAPRKDPPALVLAPAMPEREQGAPRTVSPSPVPAADPLAADMDAMKASLKAGVQTVSAPQLFPTPPAIAAQMIEEADIQPHHRVLEPSAGTGNLLKAIAATVTCEKIAVEINPAIAKIAQACTPDPVICADFLECNGNLGLFDRIVMNPPFTHGADIQHILHARHFLKPGGKIVALCANGPRQQAALKPLADSWRELEPGSFQAEGTGVNVAMLTITKTL